MVTVSRSFSNSLVLSLIGKLLTSSEEKNAYKINKNKFWVGLGLFTLLLKVIIQYNILRFD
jgi:hypothetical protein